MGTIIDGLDLDEIRHGPQYWGEFVPEGPFVCDWCPEPASYRLERRHGPLPRYPHNVACDEHRRRHGWKYSVQRKCWSWVSKR